jgi:Xaa-Pro dipeptidase
VTIRAAAPRDLAFGEEEYRTRLARVQARLRAADIDVLLSFAPENIYYLTGFHTMGYYAYQLAAVPAAGEPVLLTRALEAGNVATYAWVEGRAYDDQEDVVMHTERLARSLGERVAVEKDAWFLEPGQYERLCAALGQPSLVDGTQLIDRERLVKSAAEIGYIRQAAHLAARGLQVGVEAVRPGVRECDVAAAMQYALIGAGSDPTSVYVQSGYRAGQAHQPYSQRVLEAGDVIVFELAGVVRRYGAALATTVFVGEPDPELARMAAVNRAALEDLLREIRPGLTSGEVDELGRRAFRAEGLEHLFLHRTGYSMGIGFPPGWGEWDLMDFRPHGRYLLEPNTCWHLVPHLIERGRGATSYSQTILVTDAGVESLTDFPQLQYVR